MMGIDERIFYLILGGIIGFILGYFVRKLREIDEKLESIDEIIHDPDHEKDERGTMKIPRFTTNGVALALVVLLVFFSSVQSQRASNKTNDTANSIIKLQADQKQNLDCTTQILFDAIKALNDRTTYSGAQADANIALVQAQFDWLTKAQDRTLTQEQQLHLFNDYVAKVQNFLTVATQNANQLKLNSYPTVDDLTNCLAASNADTPEPEGN